LPGWFGIENTDYFSSEDLWFEANRKAVETFPEVWFLPGFWSEFDGIFLLDDLVGFLGEEDFLEFGFPYFKELYATDVTVKFFHNDAPCAKSVRHYPALGINLLNPDIQSTLNDLRDLAGPSLTLLGNIPPRDVLANGSPANVRAAVKKLLAGTRDHSRLILSCGGGLPPGVTTENIKAFVEAARG
jgi:uroporphyrinogen decarboxylase